MAKERQNFVYGNEEEDVPGCIANGIDEKTANKIYDDMTDFAKYAFNKSHAAAYAVVAYQTAYLKYYYPVEFMAALMTSVIDNPPKVAEYIMTCRQMGIRDPAAGHQCRVRAGFTVDGQKYPLWSVCNQERRTSGDRCDRGGAHAEVDSYRSLKDFIERLTGKEIE